MLWVLGSFINRSYIGLLGIVPLLLGLYKLYQQCQIIRSRWEARRSQREDAHAASNAGIAIPLATLTPTSATPAPLPASAASPDEESVLMRTPVFFHEAEVDENDGGPLSSLEPLARSSLSPGLPAVTPPPPEAVVPSQVVQTSAVLASSPPSTQFSSMEWLVLCLSTVIDRNSLKVASVTMANGSDNRQMNDTQQHCAANRMTFTLTSRLCLVCFPVC